jgi:hypothetical protein
MLTNGRGAIALEKDKLGPMLARHGQTTGSHTDLLPKLAFVVEGQGLRRFCFCLAIAAEKNTSFGHVEKNGYATG